MKKNNKNTILTVITASLLLLATGCSQFVEVANIEPDITTDSIAVTTINTEAETPKETTAVTAAQTTAQITTAAATTVITTAPVTETQPVTKQTEVQEAPVITTTTTTKAAPVVTTTTTTTTPAPKQEEPEDRSYLNLSPSEVQGILDECTKYAKSLGYTVMTYSEYQKKIDELDKAFYELKDTDEGYQKYVEMCQEFDSMLKCITDVPVEEFWNGNWHYIMYAGNFKKKYVNNFEMSGYDTHCSSKEESIEWVTDYLKYWIEDERSDHYQTGGRSISIAGTKLRIFDDYGRENDGVWGMVSYETIHQEYSSSNIYDLDTSYAFSVKSF